MWHIMIQVLMVVPVFFRSQTYIPECWTLSLMCVCVFFFFFKSINVVTSTDQIKVAIDSYNTRENLIKKFIYDTNLYN